MKHISRYLMTLVALFTMSTSTWADEVTIGDGTGTTHHTPYNSLWGFSYVQQVYTADEIGMAGTINSIAFCLSESDQTNEFDIFMKHVTRETFSNKDFESVTADNMVYSGSITFSAGWTTITLDTPFEYDGTQNLMIAFHEKTPGYSTRYFYCTPKTGSIISAHSDSYDPNPYDLSSYEGNTYVENNRANIKLDIESSFKVEISEDKSEASFAMPAFDATVNYEIVRDLAVKTSVNIIIGEGDDAVILTKDSRLRIALDDNNSYQPVSALSCSLTDSIENNEEIAMDDFADAKLIPQFYLKGENDTWTLVTDFDPQTGLPSNLQPGQVYAITLAADEGSAYDGETAPSFTITLFEGYEMEIAAGEYATFYKDEALYIEDENAVIYTISSIEGDKAVLSDAISVAPAETPLLIFNAGSEKKNFVIIPAEEGTEADDVEATPEFKGTLVDKEMPASTSTTSYYICNKHDFVRVKDAGTIAKNRCWIEIGQMAARQLEIVFGEATGVEGLKNSRIEELNIYDLNGRKLDKMPTRKGVYIMNGKKVVIK